MILKWCFAFKSVVCVYAIFDCSFYLICITKYITPLCLVAHYILKYVIYLSTFGDSAFESQKNIVWRKNVLQEAYTLWSKHLSNYVKKSRIYCVAITITMKHRDYSILSHDPESSVILQNDWYVCILCIFVMVIIYATHLATLNNIAIILAKYIVPFDWGLLSFWCAWNVVVE